MRALAVRARDGVQQSDLTGAVQLVRPAQARMKAEETVEIEQPAVGPRRRKREHTALSGIIRVGVGRGDGEPVRGAAQDDENETRIRRRVCQYQTGRDGERCARAQAFEYVASGQHVHLR